MAQQLVIWLEEDEGDEEFEKLSAIGSFVYNNYNGATIVYAVEEV